MNPPAASHHRPLADASIRLDSIPAEGRELRVVVPEDEREAIAARLDVTSVDRLEVRLRVVKFRGGVRVTGRLEADVVQPSVVSLEPVRQAVAEPIDRIFLPGDEKEFAGPADAEVFVDLEGEDLPDRFDGSEADLSELIVETLALGIDPYPRAEGESIEAAAPAVEADQDESPFAVLKALKDKAPDKP